MQSYNTRQLNGVRDGVHHCQEIRDSNAAIVSHCNDATLVSPWWRSLFIRDTRQRSYHTLAACMFYA